MRRIIYQLSLGVCDVKQVKEQAGPRKARIDYLTEQSTLGHSNLQSAFGAELLLNQRDHRRQLQVDEQSNPTIQLKENGSFFAW